MLNVEEIDLQANSFMNDKYTLRGEMKRHESMARHISWRVGGLADNYFKPADLEDLKIFLSMHAGEQPYTWIGLGSNLLVRDGGIRGTVIALTGALDEMLMIRDGIFRIEAGVTCAKAARFIAASGYTGTEFLAGIPGTIGGALAMNAGAFGGEIWEVVTHAETIDLDGRIHKYRKEELGVSYRNVRLPENQWFVTAEFKLEIDRENIAHEKIRELIAKRSETQPIGELSCGSVFRNPENDHAARLIDASGLKGHKMGHAYVSEKHANFILNDGDATAADIENLVCYVQEVVYEKFQIRLESEVRIVGESS